MTFVLGGFLAAGILLALSPWLWPHRSRPAGSLLPSRLSRLLSAAGLGHVPARGILCASAGCAVLSAAIVWLVIPVPVLAGIAGVASGFAPLAWLRARVARVRRARRNLWPDICDLLIASVRAGMGLPDAVASLAESAPSALRPAFGRFAGDLSASGHFDSGAVRLKEALADPVADRIIETLRMARQVGGTELTTVLQALSTSVRAEAALRSEVEARQSWVRGAAVLGVTAPWVILALLALRPEGARAYGSPDGVVLIVAGALVSAVAFRIMLRIGRLPESRRWFG
ncbi:type II secretion system F family protein [Microbacterium rhizomatis]|uniref:Type II secretion protein F n=1 Tax=Microbacterium rhizomatis TaxID=1631477 RepID=A0A5J5J684_9MICO|nr:type II secretion system F family protein [Microbacterium rhizomatis]KAA9110368.1 type II secretion protein F [Microbacterium rhizomatis]